MEERNGRFPTVAEDLDEGGWRDQDRAGHRPVGDVAVPGRRPRAQTTVDDDERVISACDERTVREGRRRHRVTSLDARLAIEAFLMETSVDGVRASVGGVESPPDLREANVVLSSTQRARPMARGERRGFVQEEQLREPPGLHQRRPMPASEPEPARDPPLDGVSTTDPPFVVVQTPSVAVHEPAGGRRDQLAERRDPVLQRHRRCLPSRAVGEGGVEPPRPVKDTGT
jgi:hypothetical protein